jgi:hypothetical protein
MEGTTGPGTRDSTVLDVLLLARALMKTLGKSRWLGYCLSMASVRMELDLGPLSNQDNFKVDLRGVGAGLASTDEPPGSCAVRGCSQS